MGTGLWTLGRAARALARERAFSGVVVLTVALGVSARGGRGLRRAGHRPGRFVSVPSTRVSEIVQ